MAALHLVRQLRFTRSEFMRCLEGLGEEDALKRLPPPTSTSTRSLPKSWTLFSMKRAGPCAKTSAGLCGDL